TTIKPSKICACSRCNRRLPAPSAQRVAQRHSHASAATAPRSASRALRSSLPYKPPSLVSHSIQPWTEQSLSGSCLAGHFDIFQPAGLRAAAEGAQRHKARTLVDRPRPLVEGCDIQREVTRGIAATGEGQSSLEELQPMSLACEIGAHSQPDLYGIARAREGKEAHQRASLVQRRVEYVLVEQPLQ